METYYVWPHFALNLRHYALFLRHKPVVCLEYRYWLVKTSRSILPDPYPRWVFLSQTGYQWSLIKSECLTSCKTEIVWHHEAILPVRYCKLITHAAATSNHSSWFAYRAKSSPVANNDHQGSSARVRVVVSFQPTKIETNFGSATEVCHHAAVAVFTSLQLFVSNKNRKWVIETVLIKRF